MFYEQFTQKMGGTFIVKQNEFPGRRFHHKINQSLHLYGTSKSIKLLQIEVNENISRGILSVFCVVLFFSFDRHSISFKI